MSDDLPLLGFGLPVSGGWARPDLVLCTAQRAEELGYAALWTFQRLLYPVSDAAGEPSYPLAVHDPLLSLAHVAGRTSRIGLGTATICAPFTPPVVLAQATASLDHLSAGRLTVGLGIGWMPEEYAATGVPFQRRGARMEDYLRCLDALWTQDPVEHTGEFYSIPRSHPRFAPLQQPRPPVLLGGSAPAALRRAGRLGDGWICSSRHDLTRIGEAIALVREGAEAAGRDPDALRIVLRAVVELDDAASGTADGRDRPPLHGTREQVLHDLAGLRAQGVTEAFVDLNLSSRVASPGLGAQQSHDEGHRVLEALAPAASR